MCTSPEQLLDLSILSGFFDGRQKRYADTLKDTNWSLLADCAGIAHGPKRLAQFRSLVAAGLLIEFGTGLHLKFVISAEGRDAVITTWHDLINAEPKYVAAMPNSIAEVVLSSSLYDMYGAGIFD